MLPTAYVRHCAALTLALLLTETADVVLVQFEGATTLHDFATVDKPS